MLISSFIHAFLFPFPFPFLNRYLSRRRKKRKRREEEREDRERKKTKRLFGQEVANYNLKVKKMSSWLWDKLMLAIGLPTKYHWKLPLDKESSSEKLVLTTWYSYTRSGWNVSFTPCGPIWPEHSPWHDKSLTGPLPSCVWSQLSKMWFWCEELQNS